MTIACASIARPGREPYEPRTNPGVFLAMRGFAQPVSPAADYPAKPVRVVVGQAPGGGNDIQTRLFAQKLSEALGRSFVVENRTGAGSVVSYRTVAAAPPDGYTLLAASGGFTIAPSVHANLGYDPVKRPRSDLARGPGAVSPAGASFAAC
jgi:tripartite-type tricarboxylate transporter receptor subunit TctC